MGDEREDDMGAPPNPESVRVLFDLHKFLLEDQVHLAETLRNARRTASALLLILVGFGLFKVETFSSVEEKTVLIRSLISAAIGCFLVGAFYLFTERSVIWSLWKAIKRYAKRTTVPVNSGLALSRLRLTSDEIVAQSKLDPTECLLVRATEFSDSYEALKSSNYRVRARLGLGTIYLLLGISLAFAAFLVYLWTVGSTDEHSTGTRTRDQADASGASQGDAASGLSGHGGAPDGPPDRDDPAPNGASDRARRPDC